MSKPTPTREKELLTILEEFAFELQNNPEFSSRKALNQILTLTESENQTPMSEESKDGTIIEFLLGEKSFEGVWFHSVHPTKSGMFWWRKDLRKYIESREASLISSIEKEIDGIRRSLEIIKKKN